ncbi:MAG: hypothetical protein AABY22_34440 [Nanoarchaeota archaeon]
MNNSQKIIIVESPNEKLAIQYALQQANELKIPYFFDYSVNKNLSNNKTLLQLLEQTGYDLVTTGTHVREYAFTQSLNLRTDIESIFALDYRYGKLNTQIIVLYEKKYKYLENERFVEANYMMMDTKFKEFLEQTKCKKELIEIK